ncbi:MAG: hypothetical protein IT430_03835 [Phycisphaerales bacterium]|nr:hypothetical protein [Phycisphaerales bacterium]
MPEHKRLESAKVVAEAVGVQPATVLAWYRRGWIPGYRAGLRPVLFDVDEVRRALSERSDKVVKGAA